MLFISGLILKLYADEKSTFSRFEFSKIAFDKSQLSNFELIRVVSVKSTSCNLQFVNGVFFNL